MVVLVGAVWWGAKLAFERSHYVVLSNTAADVVTEYIEEYQAWPSSWDDLRRIPIQSVMDYSTLEQKVHVDFNRRLEEVAEMDPAKVDVIRNQGRPYADYLHEGRAARLIEVARKGVELHAADPPGQ